MGQTDDEGATVRTTLRCAGAVTQELHIVFTGSSQAQLTHEVPEGHGQPEVDQAIHGPTVGTTKQDDSD